MTTAAQQARKFLAIAPEFRLGELPTEQSHPKTRDLSRLAVEDLPKALKTLLAVDAAALEMLLSDVRGLAELRKRSGLRIAGGEGAREMDELREYLHHGSLDVYQPDVAWSTGIYRARQLAQEVQAASAIYSPHTWGDGLVLLANLHVSAAISTAPFIEFPFDPPTWTPERRDFILPQPLLPTPDGVLTLPDAPGLGVEIDWDDIEDSQ